MIHKKGGLPYTQLVNRRLGHLLALSTPNYVSPTQITLLSFLLFLLACIILSFASSQLLVSIAVLLLLFQYALDSADGILARMRSCTSQQGAWLDHSLDFLKIFILQLSLYVLSRRLNYHASDLFLIAGFVTLFSQSSYYTISALNYSSLPSLKSNLSTKIQRFSRYILFPIDNGIYYISVLFSLSRIYPLLYVSYSAFWFIFFTTAFIKFYRSISD